MVLPNTLWKLIHPLSQSLTDFLVAWKNPFLLKLKSKKTPLTSYIYMKKSLLIEKIFSNFLLDLFLPHNTAQDLYLLQTIVGFVWIWKQPACLIWAI